MCSNKSWCSIEWFESTVLQWMITDVQAYANTFDGQLFNQQLIGAPLSWLRIKSSRQLKYKTRSNRTNWKTDVKVSTLWSRWNRMLSLRGWMLISYHMEESNFSYEKLSGGGYWKVEQFEGAHFGPQTQMAVQCDSTIQIRTKPRGKFVKSIEFRKYCKHLMLSSGKALPCKKSICESSNLRPICSSFWIIHSHPYRIG